MKRKIEIRLRHCLYALLATVVLNSCIREEDFDAPESIPSVITEIPSNITITELRALYTGSLVAFSSSTPDEELVVSGFVISNDANGNFENILYIQDQAKDPLAGIAIAIDQENSNSVYPVGKNIGVSLNGLALDQINGVLQLGIFDEVTSSLQPISKSEFLEKTTRGLGISAIIPVEVTPKQLQDVQLTPEVEDDLIGTLVQLRTMQLITEERGRNFTETGSTGLTELNISDCNDRATISIATDSEASFSESLFPELQGTITAVYTNNGLRVRSTNDIRFANDRCDFVEPTANVTIAQVRELYTNVAVPFTSANLGLASGTPPVLSGYVVSSDQDNNIQNTIYIQDAVSNPTAGIAIDIRQTGLFTAYPIGQKIFINLTGLGIDSENPELHIGNFNDSNGSIIPLFPGTDPVEEIIINSIDPIENIVPTVVSVADVADNLVPDSILIRIEDMQLDCTEKDMNNTFRDAFRTMYNCTTQNNIQLFQVEDDAVFVDDIVSNGRGSITAIVKELGLFDENFLLIRSKSDLALDEFACDQQCN